ncbi:MAG: glycosyltransferase family A protein [Anaerolineales bacterium]|jgi:glycosyltransferase involved in cell wall biosynthesis
MNDALVSVIMPVYNGEKLMAEAIESVLRQSYRPIEIIIIDDGSTDASAKIAARYPDQTRYFYQANAGPAAARNLGIRKAKGEFIAFIDADDLWPNDKLGAQMRCFEAFPSVELVQGLINRIKLPNQVKGRLIGAEIDFPFIYTNLGSMVMRRRVFKKIGYFEENLPFHEDTDFWLRAREAGLLILVQRKLALVYRIHGRNMTTGEDLETTGLLNIVRRSIVRRRAAGPVKDIGKLSYITDLLEKDQQRHGWEKQEPVSWPLVSIILYANGNHQQFSQAFESIRSQDYHPAELIIVGAKLGQMEELNADTYDHVSLINDRADLASGLNAALNISKGAMLAFLDAEGVWAFDKLKTQVAYLLEHSSDGYVVGRTRNILMPNLSYPADLIDEFSLRKSMGDLLSTLLIRRTVAEKVGEFRSGLAGMEETDWLLRAKDQGFSQKMLPNVCLFRFVQPDFHVVGIDKMKAALLETVRSSIHRKHNSS